MTPTPETALQAVLLRKERQFGYFVPPTPYGIILFVPSHADLDAVRGVEQWLHTDGVHLWQEGGTRLQGEDAATLLRETFESAAAALPFRAQGDDVFLQVVKMNPGYYRLYLIDPGWLDPQERHVSLKVQLPGEFLLRDLLDGRTIPFQGGTAAITVPAGTLRILDATAIATSPPTQPPGGPPLRPKADLCSASREERP